MRELPTSGSAPSFQAVFGQPPTRTTSAAGRVNLMGEHTDYNDGFVLPTVIPQRTYVELGRRTDEQVHAFSTNLDYDLSRAVGNVQRYHLGQEQSGRGWLDYVQGITQALRQRHHQISGFCLRVDSSVPLGSGLSSSAALEISVLRALRDEFQLTLSDRELAQLGQQAENELVGAPVGIMDQMASCLGVPGAALLLDTRTLDVELLPLPKDYALIVVHSGVTHNHSQGDYRVRRAECERAAALLGVSKLRDVPFAELDRTLTLPAPLDRRARHVITENQRVQVAAAALRRGDSAPLGELFYASHRSQQNDFAVSVPEIDLLVALGADDPAILGARLTGGGFGGSVVMLARRGEEQDAAARISRTYAARTGHTPLLLLPTTEAAC